MADYTVRRKVEHGSLDVDLFNIYESTNGAPLRPVPMLTLRWRGESITLFDLTQEDADTITAALRRLPELLARRLTVTFSRQEGKSDA